MNNFVLEKVLEVMAQSYLPYLIPFLFLIVVFLFSEKIIDLIYYATGVRRN